MSDWQPVVNKGRARRELLRGRKEALHVELEGVRRDLNNLLLEKEELENNLCGKACLCCGQGVCGDLEESLRDVAKHIALAHAKEARLCAQLR